MKKILDVARWEFVEKVKKKSFIIYIILFPMLLIGAGLLPGLLENSSESNAKFIGIMDRSGHYAPEIKKRLEATRLPNGGNQFYVLILNDDEKSADSKVLSRDMEGYVLLNESPNDSLKLEYRSKAFGNLGDLKTIEKACNETVVKSRLLKNGMNPVLIRQLTKEVNLATAKITAPGEKKSSDFLTMFFTGYAFVMLLLMMILFSGGMLVRSLIEEKSFRIMEILLSSMSSNELLAGKILGLSFLGLFQMAIWALVGISFGGTFLAGLDIFRNLPLELLYFVSGYVLYSAIFVGFGSIANTEQEAQQFTGYISLILIFPIVLAMQVIQNPSSTMAEVLSYFPLTSAPIMLLRINAYMPSALEIIGTVLINFVSIIGVIYLSAKIFRIGILSYGKRPSLKELLVWIRSDL